MELVPATRHAVPGAVGTASELAWDVTSMFLSSFPAFSLIFMDFPWSFHDFHGFSGCPTFRVGG